MSALQPDGIPVTIAGEERKLLLSFSAIDKIQDLYEGETVFSVLKKMLVGEGSEQITCNLLSILWNDAVVRDYMLDKSSGLGQTYEPDELAYLINLDNAAAVKNSILQACRINLPQTDEDEDEDPNQTREADK